MKNAHVGISPHPMGQCRLHEPMPHTSPDYFNEALRILDNDPTIEPKREHLTALWGLVVGLSRRLTQTLAERRHYRTAAIRTNRRSGRMERTSSTTHLPQA